VRRRVETALETARVGPTTVGASHRAAVQAVHQVGHEAVHQVGHQGGHEAVHQVGHQVGHEAAHRRVLNGAVLAEPVRSAAAGGVRPREAPFAAPVMLQQRGDRPALPYVSEAVDPGRTDRAIAATVARTWQPPAPVPVLRRPSRLADWVLLAGTIVFAVLLIAGGVALFLLVT
jgi:hypothetical protein